MQYEINDQTKIQLQEIRQLMEGLEVRGSKNISSVFYMISRMDNFFENLNNQDKNRQELTDEEKLNKETVPKEG